MHTSVTPVAGLIFRDKKSSDFSGRDFSGEELLPENSFSGSNPCSILSLLQKNLSRKMCSGKISPEKFLQKNRSIFGLTPVAGQQNRVCIWALAHRCAAFDAGKL